MTGVQTCALPICFPVTILAYTTVLKDHGTEVCCKTVYGANYVKKVTHPPSDARFEGTPSKASPNVAIFEIMAETNVPVTFQRIRGGEIGDINASAMLFLTPSGGKVGSYVFYKTANNTWTQQSWLNAPAGSTPKSICATRNDAYDWQTQYARDFSSSRQAYKSTTFYLNATKNNNQGVVTTAKFKPSIVNSLSELARTFNIDLPHDDAPMTLRNLIRCHKSSGHKSAVQQLSKILDDANMRNNLPTIPEDDGYQVILPTQKNVTAPITDYFVQLFNMGTINNGTVANTGDDQSNSMTGVLPTDATQLLNLSRKAASRLAQEGAFVVQSDSDDVNLFTSVPINREDTNFPGKNGLLLTLLVWFNPLSSGGVGTVNYVPLLDDSPRSGTEREKFSDIPWNMSDWSWTLFDGLSTTNAEAWGLPYITVKTVTGWEAQPRTKSFAALVQRLLPLPDPDALEMAAGIHSQRPDSLPASANDLGSIASTVLQFLPTAVGWLKDLFGSKPKQEQAMQKAREFVRPKPQRPKKQPSVNKIANAVANKLEHKQHGAPINTYIKNARNQNRPKPKRDSRAPRIVADKNPGEQYAQPRGRSNSRLRSSSQKRPLSRVRTGSM